MIALEPIDAVRPSAYNPRLADPARLDLIELSLRKLGFVLPLFADAGGEILSGHQRHLVARRMGAGQVPVARTPAFDLPRRQAVNIAFNRGTNDFAAEDTPSRLAASLAGHDPHRLAARLPDKPVGAPAFYPCLAARRVPIGPLLRANGGRWQPYAKAIAKTLAGKGLDMPIVVTAGDRVVNGIGRLEAAAERRAESVAVVAIPEDEAPLAALLLNRLSMEFDLQGRYPDLLRHNSFRRARRVRRGLGRGFVFAVIGNAPAHGFDITRPDHARRWRRVHGDSVVDFGAGHLTETGLLRAAGVEVTPFEPYRLGAGQDIDRAESLALGREFLAAVAAGRRWSSVFVASVLNSVPFHQDRVHIVRLCSALCGPDTRLYAVASSVRQSGWESVSGKSYTAETHAGGIAFRLDYEPGIAIGDFSTAPKVQKYHRPDEFRRLFGHGFRQVEVSEYSNNVQAVCRSALPVEPALLRQAIEFEFDLPYPDGSRMGLVAEALAAFGTRLGIAL